MISAPVLALARAELHRRWRSLVLIGLLAGLVGATVVSAAALARRTTTAHARLGERTGVDDARGTVLRHPDLLDDIVALPAVTDRWTGRVAVAQLDGTFSFLGITAGPDAPSPIVRPIVLEGRLPGAAEEGVLEVALRDDFQREVGIPIGTEVPVRFLTEADYFRFDTGFEGGAPHGPELTVRVVGTIRMAGGFSSLPPGFAAPEAIEAHPEAFIGSSWFVRLDGGAGAVEGFRQDVAALAEGRELPPEAQEFVVVDVTDTASADAAVDHTARLLGQALAALAIAAILTGGFAVVQVYARHHAAASADREVEAALGLTGGQQRTARLVAGLVPTTLAATLTAAAALLSARLEPIGAIRHYEPAPGPALNVAIFGLGVAAVAVAVLAADAATDALSGRRRVAEPLRESRLVERASRLGTTPEGVLGLRFALEPGRGGRAVPVRSAITGAVVGVAGVVAGLVFVASLDRLVSSPSRSGIPFDSIIADVTLEDLEAEVLDSPLVGDLTITRNAAVRVDGLELDGHALTDVRGALDVDLATGRLPRTPDEVVLGLRAAGELDKAVGDTVTAVGRDGTTEHILAVVGTGVVPTFNGEQLGLNAVVTTEGLERVGLADPFTSAAVGAAPGTEPRELIDWLAERFEADAQATPTEVQNLEQLGRLPAAVSALVGAIAVVALANALVVAVRRRRGDLALLRSIGFVGRQTAVTVLVMALTIVAIGIAIGVPVGVAVGSTLWRFTADGAFVVTDANVRWSLVAAVAAGAVAVALLAAVLPARRAARQAPGTLLRAE